MPFDKPAGRIHFFSMVRRAQFCLAATMTLCVVASATAQSAMGLIVGSVTDSVHRRPLANAMIIAIPISDRRDSVFHSAISDASGRFTMDAVPIGRYSLTVEHPFIDSTGIGVYPRDIDVRGPMATDVALGIPSPATLRRALCPLAVRDTTLGVVLGTVHRLDHTLARGVAVVFAWNDFDVDRATATFKRTQLTARVFSDSVGVYRACGLPVARTLYIQAQGGSIEQTGVFEQQIGAAGVLVRDLTLAAQLFSVAAGDASGTRRPAFDERIARSNDEIISETQIEQRHAFLTTDLIRLLRGYSVRFTTSAAFAVIRWRRLDATDSDPACVAHVFMDGLEIVPGEINLTLPFTVRGLEAFDAFDVPARYHVEECGAVFLRTRSRSTSALRMAP